MVQFLPVAGSWRCKEGIYQRRPVRWWRWVFTASFLHAWSPHQSDGGSEGEIFIPPAHCKITYLGPMSPPPPSPFLPLLTCHPRSPMATMQCQHLIPASSGQSSALWWTDTNSFSDDLGTLQPPEQHIQGSSALFIPCPVMWEMPCLSPKYVSLKSWWWCTKVL